MTPTRLWELCASDFKPDGSLRDVYVLNTTIDDWQKLLEWLHASFRVELRLEGRPVPLPLAASDVFARDEKQLFVRVGTHDLLAFFFRDDTIELSLDPQSYSTRDNFQALMTFIKGLGTLLKKEVRLTPENFEAEPIITFNDDHRQFEFHVPRAARN